MRVLIAGAGLIGTVYGAHLAAAGSTVSVLSHGPRTDEVAAGGLSARDVLGRCIADEAGLRWSQTEHTASPPELEPEVGWMQGAAGIAGWLLRLARLERDGASARRIWWPDRPALT